MFAIRAGKRAKHSNRRENGKETDSVETEKYITEESGDKEKAEVSEQKKEEKHTDTVSKEKYGKSRRKSMLLKREISWYYDEERFGTICNRKTYR